MKEKRRQPQQQGRRASGAPAETDKWSILKVLGPGLITGASDDDPSGIATYSQAGAQLGFSVAWIMLFSYPLMAVIQEISARIGRTTGRGIAGNIRKHYSEWVLQPIVLLLFVANTINIGADLGAMGEALKLLVGGPRLAYVLLFGLGCATLEIIMKYARYVSILKWLTLSLLTYFATVLVVKMPWAEVAWGLFVPTLSANSDFWTAIVAILGTTISPYLFFWQASQEVEEIKANAEREPLLDEPRQAPEAYERIRIDTYVGMAFSNLVGLAILLTTAATLHKAGVTNIDSASQAAEALKPVAGDLAFVVFAAGIIGTGLLSVPVLAGSGAYAVGEAMKWPTGLDRRPKNARAFYATIAIATALGIALNFTPINPVKALYWSAVINGVVAVPVMATMMVMTASDEVMGEFRLPGLLRLAGWIATAIMAAAAIGMGVTAFF